MNHANHQLGQFSNHSSKQFERFSSW